jgi:hypothetical protein
VRRDEDGVRVEAPDRLRKRWREPTAPEIGERDAGSIHSRRVLMRMISDRDDGESEAVCLEHNGGTRRLAIHAGADGRDPCGL